MESQVGSNGPGGTGLPTAALAAVTTSGVVGRPMPKPPGCVVRRASSARLGTGWAALNCANCAKAATAIRQPVKRNCIERKSYKFIVSFHQEHLPFVSGWPARQTAQRDRGGPDRIAVNRPRYTWLVQACS